MKIKNNLKTYVIVLVMCVCIIMNCSIALASNEGLKAGTYTSHDGQHTITVNGDGTFLYDGTTSLTETANDRGNILKGSAGTFYQLNNSKLVNGSDFTVFSLDTEPVVNANGGIEVWSNGSKVNTYADLQSAVDAAKTGDTIKIIKDLDVVGGAYVSGKNLIIDGQSHKINSATWANSVFIVEEDATLNVKNLTIDGGATGFEVNRDAASGTTIPLKANSDVNDPKQNLSVIISKGNLSTDKLNMNNNYINGNGAAIRVVSGNIILNNSSFDHNRASAGGAIYVGSNFKENQTEYPVQSVRVENTNLTRNYSSNAGGIYIYNTDNVSIKNSNFTTNTVTRGKGGGIFFYYQGATDSAYYSMARQLGLDFIQVEIDNCTFDGNWVGNDGYAIENQGAEMLITNTTFKNNVGTSSSSVGTISNMLDDTIYYDVILKNCIFEKNDGPVSGIGDHATKINLLVENTKFIENESWENTLIYAGDAIFKNCEFIREKIRVGIIAICSMAHPVDNPSYHEPQIIIEDTIFTDTVYDSADIIMYKYNRNMALNTANLYLKGNTNGNVHIWDDNRVVVNGTHTGNIYVWDDNRVVVNGNHTGNIYKDSFTSADEGIKISENATVDGEINYNNDKCTYSLTFWDIEDGFECRKYLYLDKDRTYTQREIFMEHFISEEGYELKYYTDSACTHEWDYTSSVTTNKVKLYGKWVEHTHTYDGTTVLYENALYDQCICGYLGKSLTLSEPSDLVENDKEKPIVVNDEIGIESKDYTIAYQVMNKDGLWEEYDGVPVKEGKYKAILIYNNSSIEKEYAITEKVVIPDDNKDTSQKPDDNKDTSQKPDDNKDTSQKPDDNKDTSQKPDDNKDMSQKPEDNKNTSSQESEDSKKGEKTESVVGKFNNPNTSDNILKFVVAFIFSFISIVIIIIYYKKIKY